MKGFVESGDQSKCGATITLGLWRLEMELGSSLFQFRSLEGKKKGFRGGLSHLIVEASLTQWEVVCFQGFKAFLGFRDTTLCQGEDRI